MMNKKPSIFTRTFYRLDNIIANGGWRVVYWLGVLVFILVFLGASIITFWEFSQSDKTIPSILEIIQLILPRSLFLLIPISILFLLSLVIAVIFIVVQDHVKDLRRGRNRVLEEEHYVILGWSQKIFKIIHELILSEQKQREVCIVVMAEKAKIEMRHQLYEKVSNFRQAKIICRTGNPVDIDDIHIVNPHKAKTILILPPKGDESDVSVIKTLLAIINGPFKKVGRYNIITEINSPSNTQVAHIIAQEQVTILNTKEIIARITVQTARQSGLSSVYSELMDFKGAEIYFHQEKKVWGKTFKEVQFAYENSVVIGIKKNNIHFSSPINSEPFLRVKEREIVINPLPEYVLQEGDNIIVINRNQHSINITEEVTNQVIDPLIIDTKNKVSQPERILIVGWNRNASKIIRELDSYVAKGSEVHVLSVTNMEQEQIDKFNKNLKKLKFLFRKCDITDRRILEYEKPNSFNHVIVLSNTDDYETEEADSRCLITLIHLRDIAKERGGGFNIVSEMADPRNQALAETALPDDFIIGENISSMMLSQLAGNKELKKVFEEFFDADGCVINLKPASNYVELEEEVNFYTILESAIRQEEIPIGYRIAKDSQNPSKNYGVILNPNKSEYLQLSEEDKIVVITDA